MSFSKEKRGNLAKGIWKCTKQYLEYFTKSRSMKCTKQCLKYYTKSRSKS